MIQFSSTFVILAYEDQYNSEQTLKFFWFLIRVVHTPARYSA